MKSVLVLFSLLSSTFASTSAFAFPNAEYKCNSSTERGVLRIVDTKFAEPRVDFFPKGDSNSDTARVRYSAYFSELQNNRHSTANYLTLNETDYLLLMKVYTSVQMDANILLAGKTVRVLLTKRTQSVLGKKLLNLDVKSFVCHLQ